MKRTMTEEMLMASKTLEDLATHSRAALMELKCDLENWNLFDCLKDGTTIILKQYY